MKQNNHGISTSVPFLTLLALIFITLKLCDVIDWSWWWVTSPLWIPAGVVTMLMTIATITALAITFHESKDGDKW